MDQISLTVLRSKGKIPVCKIVRRDGTGAVRKVRDYPSITWWTREAVTLPADIDDLGAALEAISQQPDCCIVSGSPTATYPLSHLVRRLKHSQADHGATLEESASRAFPIDADHIPLPFPLDPVDPEPAIQAIVDRLGAPFTEASYVWQLTSSASPGAREMSCRLWFITDTATTNDERKAWANGFNAQVGVKFIDPAIYQAAQPIYTARPEFSEGTDPFPRRSGIVYGEQEVVTWADVPKPEKQTAAGNYSGRTWAGQTPREVSEWLEAIGDGPGQLGFHEPITMAIFGMVAARWTPGRIEDVIRTTALRADRTRHQLSYVESQTSHGTIADSIKGAARRLKAAELPARVTRTATAVETVTLDQAQAQLTAAIGAWVRGDGPGKLVISATVGSGKTRAAVDSILSELAEGQRLVWAFPTHDQGQEVLDRLGPKAVKIEGRTRGEQPLCQRPDLIKTIAQAGLARHTVTIACKSSRGQCPHFAGCGYYRQFLGAEQVRLVPHALLQHQDARAFRDFGSSLIIDESPLGDLIGSKSFPLETVLSAGGLLADCLRTWQAGGEVDAGVRDNLEAEMSERCVSDLPASSPNSADEWALVQELTRLAESKKPKLLALYKAALGRIEGEVNRLWFSQDGAAVWCAWRHQIPEQFQRVLILDATAQPEVYRALLGDDVEFIRIDVQQNLEIIQADAVVGKRRVVDPDNDGLLARVCALTRATGSGLITNLDGVKLAKERGWISEETQTGHFQALRGLNSMEALDSLVIAGRPEPPALSIEQQARALWPREALNLPGSYQWTQDGIASVASHPDARCDALLRAAREAELAQAIGRLRAVRSPTRKTIYLLTSTPIDNPVTRRRLDEILLPEKLARLMLKCGGVAPLSPTLMHTTMPELWPTVNAAKFWIQREKVSFSLYKIIYKQFDTYSFRPKGTDKPSRALSWLPDMFDVWQAIEQSTGIEVADLKPHPDPTPAPAWTKPEFVIHPQPVWTKPAYKISEISFSTPRPRVAFSVRPHHDRNHHHSDYPRTAQSPAFRTPAWPPDYPAGRSARYPATQGQDFRVTERRLSDPQHSHGARGDLHVAGVA